MKVVAAFLATLLVAGPVLADAKHTLVLKSEGNADGKVRGQIDSALLKIAKENVDGVAPGDMSFGDAAAAVGCSPDAASCAGDVMATLSVDEIISAKVTKKPNGFEVVVRRAQKGGVPKEAVAKISDAQDALFAPQLALLFGKEAPKPVEPPPTPAIVDTQPTPPPDLTPQPPVDTQPQPLPPMPPPAVEDQQHNRLILAGMIGGGGLVLLGIIMWGQAAGTQSDIDNAPSRTVADLQHIQDLEKQGDGQAGLGNLLFIGGIALAGVSTFFYIRERRAHQDPIAIGPTLFSHGAGIALTIGGSR